MAPLTLGSVAVVGHELGSAGRPPEVGSSIDGSSAAVTLPRDTTARRRPHHDALGIWVSAMTDNPAWVGNFNWTPGWGFRPNEADWLFGVYHRTPVQPWIAALFIADTGAAK